MELNRIPLTRTRFEELAIAKVAGHIWRFVARDDASEEFDPYHGCVGASYRTKAEAFGDLERFAADYGCASASKPFNAAEWNEQGTSCPTCGSKTQRYNGWTNYETWAVALWLGNDEGSYSYWTERAQEIVNTVTAGSRFGEFASMFSNEDAQTAALAKELEASHEETRPDMEGIFLDLLSAALSAVEWREIARHYLDECTQPEIEEEEEEAV